MRITLTTPLTDEQQKLFDELERVNMMIGLLAGPMPLTSPASAGAIHLEIGSRGMVALQRAELDRLQVLAFVLEYRLTEIEAGKGQ
jgi:hypothetical protein